MRPILTLLFLTILSTTSFAQPQTWKKSYLPKEGKKTNKYLKRAEKYLEAKHYYHAFMNAHAALESEPRKKQSKKIQKIFPQAYENCLNAHHQAIDEYKQSSQVVKGDDELQQRYEILRKYTELARVQKLVDGMDNKMRRKLKSNRNIDYDQETKKASESLEKGKSQVVEDYYITVKNSFKTSRTREDFRRTAKEAIRVYDYAPKYKTIENIILESYENGTSKTSIRYFYRTKSSDLNSTRKFDIERHLSNYLTTAKNELSFVSYLPHLSNEAFSSQSSDLDNHNLKADQKNDQRDKQQEVDYRVEGTILKYNIVPSQETGEIRRSEKKKLVGKKEKGKDRKLVIYKASIQPMTNRVAIEAELAIEIVDNLSGKILFTKEISDTYYWEHEWAKFLGGDREALDSFDSNLVATGNRNNPSPDELAIMAASQMGKTVGKLIHDTMEYQKF